MGKFDEGLGKFVENRENTEGYWIIQSSSYERDFDERENHCPILVLHSKQISWQKFLEKKLLNIENNQWSFRNLIVMQYPE